MWSSVATRYQLGLLFQAGLVTAPLSASTPHGTCESAMNAAFFAFESAANDAANFRLVEEQEAVRGGRIGGTGRRAAGSRSAC